MQFRQFYLGCLAHASYYIGSGEEAAIVDPQRDIEQYLDEANTFGQRIKYVIETHSHADFVSGHIELAEKTGAEIVFGERAKTEFPTLKVKDGDELSVGAVKLKFIETPGHTPEGITILVEDAENPGEPVKMLTGDTLFVGDVGRPDLVGSRGFTAEEMGSMLYDSIHEKLLPLADDIEIYPAHGAGSLCGKSLSKETWSTLGQQRKTNYALQPMSKEEFIKLVSSDQPEIPAYFPKSAAQNLKGAAALDNLPKPEKLSTEEISRFDGIIIDVRPAAQFGAGHVPGSLNIGLGGQFASWAGTVIAVGSPVAIVAETRAQVDEAFMRLARVGIESVKGYTLIGEYAGESARIEQVSVESIRQKLSDEMQFVDVRRAAEHASGHAPQTINMPLDTLPGAVERLNREKPTYVICQGGYRSSLGTSILEKAGFREVYNVTGGTKAWTDAGFETEVSATACAKS